ncbi:alcohol dehydrogenase catalytic domain-containing protein [Brachybacterium sp. Z12]|uniref:alcohol dehydrogenase catalytic domain-containing protein n=1 Tax=Brachybacterium sp. Z12 TaxID=2759167 RepID=UPI00223AAF1C|nr:alcohol dehydrogenase catalytic domain-containing protein [Brachybacterium sp. Z12]
MRALVLSDYHHIDVVERPRPRPSAGEVLLRIAATGICGSDFHGFTGDNGRRFPGQIMGHEAAGTIAAHGPGVDVEALPLGAPATFNPWWSRRRRRRPTVTVSSTLPASRSSGWRPTFRRPSPITWWCPNGTCCCWILSSRSTSAH